MHGLKATHRPKRLNCGWFCSLILQANLIKYIVYHHKFPYNHPIFSNANMESWSKWRTWHDTVNWAMFLTGHHGIGCSSVNALIWCELALFVIFLAFSDEWNCKSLSQVNLFCSKCIFHLLQITTLTANILDAQQPWRVGVTSCNSQNTSHLTLFFYLFINGCSWLFGHSVLSH